MLAGILISVAVSIAVGILWAHGLDKLKDNPERNSHNPQFSPSVGFYFEDIQISTRARKTHSAGFCGILR